MISLLGSKTSHSPGPITFLAHRGELQPKAAATVSLYFLSRTVTRAIYVKPSGTICLILVDLCGAEVGPVGGWERGVVHRSLPYSRATTSSSGSALHKKSNPTHGSGWMLQILSTMSHVYEALKSHQRKLVDCFRSFLHRITFALEILNCAYFGLIGDQLKRGSEQSTNSRWWNLASSQRFIQSREDLKHPPTAVGGIRLFGQSPQDQPRLGHCSWRRRCISL